MRALGIRTFMIVTVENYPEGISDSTPPHVTISARLLDARNNKILWYDSSQLDGDDRILAFDLGKMRSADKVARRLFLNWSDIWKVQNGNRTAV